MKYFTIPGVLLLLLFIFLLNTFTSCRKDKTLNEPGFSFGGEDASLYEQPANVPWPEWVYHHWVWEDEGTRQSAQALVDDYLAHDIPVGAIIIDSPWETDYNTFEWDNTLYPDAQAMIDYFHSKDVRVMIWITNVMNVSAEPYYSEGVANDYFLKRLSTDTASAVFSWWKGSGSAVDFFNPYAVQWWKGLMDKVLDMGIDGWKVDGADYNAFLANVRYSPYLNNFIQRIDYSHAYYRLFHDYTREKLGDDRVNTARPVDNYGFDIGGELVSFAPVDINWAGWVGDQDPTFDGMKKALNNMYHSSEMGYINFGSDIGGYREDNNYPPQMRSKELFIRWAQLGAFSPVMENGGGGEHRPWMFDDETTDIYRRFVKLRYSMLTYLMKQGELAWNEGKSLMTFFNKTDYRFMLGKNIFVTPMLSASNTITVKFPQGGRWIYLFDKTKIYDGGTTVTLDVPLSEFPVFLRDETVIRYTLRPEPL